MEQLGSMDCERLTSVGPVQTRIGWAKWGDKRGGEQTKNCECGRGRGGEVATVDRGNKVARLFPGQIFATYSRPTI